jgi:hypothetical protein
MRMIISIASLYSVQVHKLSYAKLKYLLQRVLPSH